MSKMKSLALMMAKAAISSESMYAGKIERCDSDIDFTPKTPPVPKGCKEYWFDIEGEFSTEGMRRDRIAYKCVASNDKTAIKKFEKWRDNQK